MSAFKKAFLASICIIILTPFISKSQCWDLVWSDEFDGSALDLNHWSYDIGNSGWGNNELQYYTAGNNVDVSGGSLKITADDDGFGGAAYTSSRIVTKDKVDWTYGKFEVSLKLPQGQGIWPAVWMLPTDNVYGIWPNSGEIDIMENLGHQPSTIHGTAHWAAAGGGHQYNGSSNNNSPSDYVSAFHTYTVEWDDSNIKWYIDGTLYHSLSDTDISPANWPFDQNFHLLLNVAVGGNWPGYPDASTVFPQTMEVDYIRVYQSLPDIILEGESTENPLTSGSVYSLPDISGATYAWNVSNGSISSGAGTHEILVDWGATDGTVSVDLTTACGTRSLSLPVSINANMLLNPGFEEGTNDWFADIFSSAVANFYLNTSDSYSGDHSYCADVSTLGTDTWNIQVSPIAVNLESGEEYILRFYAKANANNKDISLGIINAANFSFYGGTVFTLTDSWAYYDYTFTAPATAESNINIQFGNDLGTFCIDDVSFMKTAFLPVELGRFRGQLVRNYAYLEWMTFSETDNRGFEVQSSTNGMDFQAIGFVDGHINSSQEKSYSFAFRQNENKVYYRLKQMDFSGDFSYSPIIILEQEQQDILVFPSKMSHQLNIHHLKTPSSIILYNAQGKIVYQQEQQEGAELSIDVSQLASGLYFLSVNDSITKVLKE